MLKKLKNALKTLEKCLNLTWKSCRTPVSLLIIINIAGRSSYHFTLVCVSQLSPLNRSQLSPGCIDGGLAKYCRGRTFGRKWMKVCETESGLFPQVVLDKCS